MIKQKQKIDALGAYVAPECEALELQSRESVLLGSDILNSVNALYDEEWDLGEI